MARPIRPGRLAALGGACLALAGCGSGTHHLRAPAQRAANPPSASETVWLCRPGLPDDPCTSALTSTVLEPDGATRIVPAKPARDPKIDCFYVYPTISPEPTVNANLAIGFAEEEVAIAQAARFSQVCRVYAPVYRQITLSALDDPSRITRADALVAYRSVLAAFRVYLAKYNHGRGIVFIGHSQGAFILIRLLAAEFDRDATLRRRLVSAILPGGNLTVRRGSRVGGGFGNIPACSSPRETGCVVAYSSFAGTPPAGSEFARTTSDAGVGLLAPRDLAAGLRIMCVNPASPAGGSALLDPYLPTLVLAFLDWRGAATVRTPWVSLPGEYRADCESSGDATWLQVTRLAGATASAPSLLRLQDAALGLHLLDVNIALGNLVQLVAEEAAAYLTRAPSRG